ncbi:MAG: transposase [Candidatus Poribacteria bacterium]|nr:transposase [Candidatus Poribacteria bacterium]
MNQQELLYGWIASVTSSFSGLRRSQAKVLALYSLGVALAEHCALSEVSKALSFVAKPDTVERRLQRFLANLRIAPRPCCIALTRWTFRALQAAKHPVVVLVDETSLSDRLRAMVVALAYRGRAIPLAFRVYRPDGWPMGQVEMIDQLLGWVHEGMRQAGVPASRSVIVQADRAIGTSPDLIDAVERRGWRYLFRVQRQTRIRFEDGTQQPLSDLVPKPGKRAKVRVDAFKNAGWRPCWAIGTWQGKQEQPWLLLTNDPSLLGKHYCLRMWEEEAFRDLKSSGWQWQDSRVWLHDHAERLWLVMALAYLWVVSMGTHAIRHKPTRKQRTRGKRRRFSVFQMGLRYMNWCLNQGRSLFTELTLVLQPLDS